MVQLTTEHGTFEGQTVKEAQAQARKAAREAREKAARDKANRDLAYQRARAAGYKVYSAKFGDHLRMSDLVPASDPHFPLTEDYGRPEGEKGFRFETEDGTVFDLLHIPSGYRMSYAVVSPNGFTRAVATTNTETGETGFYAVGIAGDQLALVQLPGITPDDWSPEPTTPAPF